MSDLFKKALATLIIAVVDPIVRLMYLLDVSEPSDSLTSGRGDLGHDGNDIHYEGENDD